MQEAARHLVKLQVFYDGKDAYSFNYEGKVHVFRGTVEELAKFLQSFRAKDNKTQPRSTRGERYIDIANEIMNQTDNIIYAWSNDLSNALLKREDSPKQEQVLNEWYDPFMLDGSRFKSTGLYDKVVSTYSKVWADQLLRFADDKLCQKHSCYLMTYGDSRELSLWISKMHAFGSDVNFFVDKTGEKAGDCIKFGFQSVFTNKFAKTQEPKFIGMRGNDLIIEFSNWEHVVEQIIKEDKFNLQESVDFAKDGPVVRNDDGKLLDDLFGLLDGDPRWNVDKNHRRCVRNDGCYLMIKGNIIEMGKGSNPYLSLPWTKRMEFQVLPTSNIAVLFDVNAAGPGRFVL